MVRHGPSLIDYAGDDDVSLVEGTGVVNARAKDPQVLARAPGQK